MSIMSDIEYDVKSQLKLAQLWHFVKRVHGGTKDSDWYKAIVNNLLDDDFDLNRKVTMKPESRLLSTENHLEECTALHFVYRNESIEKDIDTFNSLLERGADYTLKNGKGQTLLHLIISSSEKYIRLSKKETLFANSILAAHVRQQNPSNPQDNNGISHLHGACVFNHTEALKLFLDNGVSVDQAVKLDSEIYPGYTPLQLAALFESFEAVQVLVSRGADVNAKNAKGMSSLDVCMKRRVELQTELSHKQIHKDQVAYADQLCKNEEIIKLLLDSQCVSAIGLSRFHVASTLKDLSIVEKLVSQIEDVAHAVPKESPIFSGWTAADFAVLNGVDSMKMLVKHGVNLDIERPDGLTTLDICFNEYSSQDVHSILSCTENWKEIYLSGSRIKLLDFLQSTAAASSDQLKLLLQNTTEDSHSDHSSWRGNTMLHLAVTISKVTNEHEGNLRVLYDKSIVEECLAVGQSIDVQNLRGESVVHLAFKLGKRDIVKRLLEHLDKQEKVSNLVDQDNLSYLHIACAEKNESLVEKLLRTCESKAVNCKGKISLHENYGSIVAGSTPLHVAVSYGSFAIAEMLLRHGADLHATDSNGMSAIHCLIMRFSLGPDHRQVADVLFRSLLEDPKDCIVEDIGLNYLHVACFCGNLQAVQKLLELGSNINAAISLLDSSEKQSLSLSSNRISFLKRYSLFTPLLMAQANPIDEVIDLLILRGADLFAKSTAKLSRFRMCKSYFPLQNKNIMRRFMLMLWEREEMQKSMEERLGMTKLHVACYLKNEESVRSVLNEGVVDVNAQICADSDIFAKCTPLHLLLTISKDFPYGMANLQFENLEHQMERFAVGPIVDLLLDRGAEVTIANAQENTPIHLLKKHGFHFTDADRCQDLLLNAHRDFSVNPANRMGMSHFHLVCYLHKAEVVEKFLLHGSVDINRPINFFAKDYPGCTPLHLALLASNGNNNWPRVSQVVDLLLKYGADVAAKDVYGNTPLHQAAVMHSPELNLLNKLLSYGADINSENVKGRTPLDKSSSDENSNECVSLFKKYKPQINGWNRLTGEGHVGRMLSLYGRNITERPEFKELLQSPDVRAVDEKGRTLIHNSVAIMRPMFVIHDNHVSAIEKFIALGIDVDYRDKSGQTALHYAAGMENAIGTRALLKCGADVNIVDNHGKSAFSRALDREVYDGRVTSLYGSDTVTEPLHLHVQKLLHLGIEVSEDNRMLSNTTKCLTRGMHVHARKFDLQEPFFSQVDITKTMKVGAASLVVFDFLKESGAITLYPYLSISERTVIDDFFKNFKEQEFDELSGIVKLQFCKMTARLKLIDPALNTLRAFLGFSFAGLCEEITRFLTNTDLKNLIAAIKFEKDENEQKEI